MINTVYNANRATKIIIIPPVRIEKNILNGFFQNQFNEESIDKIRRIFPRYKDIAEKMNCLYFDFNEYAKPSETDGLHYSKESHRIIAQNLAKFIEQSFV